MLKRVSGAAALVAVLAIGAPVWAESPMSPVHRGPPPNAASSAARQWVEPPAARKHGAAENAAAPAAEAEQSAPPIRTARHGRRIAKARGLTTRELNRQQLYGGSPGGWSAVSAPYYRGYGPAPYSNSGY
jgi:hypothetical protein